MNRPLALCVGAYALAVFLTLNFSKNLSLPFFIIITACATAFLVSYIFTKRKAFALLFLILLFSLTALLKSHFIDLKRLESARVLDGEYVVVEGRAEEVTKSSDFTVLTVSSDTVNKEETETKFSVIIRGKADADVGSKIIFGGTAEFTEDGYNRGEGCFLTVFPTFYEISETNSLIAKLRRRISEKTSGADSSSLLNSLIIADKSELSDKVKKDFRTLGISHILAISGLHLSVIVMSVYLALQRYGAGKYISVSASVVLILFYMALTGFSYSIMRAGCMMILYFIARLLRRQSDNITSLFFAVFIIILFDPWALFSLSLQLSFLSTLGILVFLPPVIRAYDRYFHDSSIKPTRGNLMKKKFFEYILVSLFSTFSATLMTLPVILINFNEVSVISPISNLFIIFIAKYFLISGCVGTILSLFGVPSPLAFFVPDVISRFMLWCISLLVKISPSLVGMDMGFVKIGSAVILIVTGLSLPFCRKVLTLPITVATVSLFFVVFNMSVSHFTLDNLRVSAVWKTGCNTILLSSGGEVCLADITLTDSGRVSDVLTLLSKRKTSKIDDAVFVIKDEVPEERIKHILSLAEVDNLTLMLPSDFEDDFFPVYRLCEEKGVGFTPVFSPSYSPFDTAEILNLDDSFVVMLDKESECMVFARAVGEDPYIPYFENCSIMFSDNKYLPFDGEELYLRNTLPLSFWRITNDRIIKE